jgi:hypothetical protein
MTPLKILCLVCQKEGLHSDVGIPGGGWRLAPGPRIGGYTCSQVCDDVITAHDEALKEKKKGKKK